MLFKIRLGIEKVSQMFAHSGHYDRETEAGSWGLRGRPLAKVTQQSGEAAALGLACQTQQPVPSGGWPQQPEEQARGVRCHPAGGWCL